MIIKQNLVPAEKYSLKCPNAMSPIGICVHNTANDASAKNEIAYMVNNTNQTSFHIAVDDIEAWQGLPLDRNGWHAGDGNGDGNRKHIGIEICYSKSGGEKFDKAEDNAAELIAQLLKERNWGVERVKKHQDFSGKYCPHRTLDLGWDRFINKIKSKLGGSMADMYKLPSGNEVDLSNRDSNIVLAKTWDEVVHLKLWVKKSDADKVSDELVKEKDFSRRLLTNFMLLAKLLGLPENSNPDTIYAAVKRLVDQPNTPPDQNSSPEGTLPATIEVNGETWMLNGVNIVDGKLQGNYKRA